MFRSPPSKGQVIASVWHLVVWKCYYKDIDSYQKCPVGLNLYRCYWSTVYRYE